MKTRNVTKSDQNGLDVSLDDFLADEDFLVDGYEGYYAVACEPDDGPAYVAIGWERDSEPQELQLNVKGRADGLEVLNALSPIMTTNALLAFGFHTVLGGASSALSTFAR